MQNSTHPQILGRANPNDLNKGQVNIVCADAALFERRKVCVAPDRSIE